MIQGSEIWEEDSNYYQESCHMPEVKNPREDIEDEEEQIGIKILTLNQMFDRLIGDIKEVEEICTFSQDCLLEIFGDFNWSKDKLIETLYSSPEKEKEIEEKLRATGFIDAQRKEKLLYQKIDSSQAQGNEVCPICLDDLAQVNVFFGLVCGHYFCNQCWINYITQANQESNPSLKCMYQKCQIKVPFSFILEVTLPCLNVFEDYKNSLCRRYTQQNKQISFCPGVNCKYFVISETVAMRKVNCKCGKTFCFTCREEYHRPASCKMVQNWNTEIRKDDLNLNWIALNTKMCPFCQKAVQKSMGCNYIKCLPPGGCGNSFCYVCSQPWAIDHKSHWKCNVYSPDYAQANVSNLQQALLQKYNFYLERFFSSESARNKALKVKQNLHFNLQILMDRLRIDYSDSSFIELALNEIIDARQVLKWSYCFSYYLSESHKKSLDLFIDFQRKFETTCESLAIKILGFFEFVAGLKQGFLNLHKSQFISDYRSIKAEIYSLVRLCSKYKQNLLECVDSGQIFIES